MKISNEHFRNLFCFVSVCKVTATFQNNKQKRKKTYKNNKTFLAHIIYIGQNCTKVQKSAKNRHTHTQ